MVNCHRGCQNLSRRRRSTSIADEWRTGISGQWCAQGDRTKRCSISAGGPFFSLTNEVGSTSSGTLRGMDSNTITAPQWQFVQGTLSSDGRQINWSNGTSWTRCDNSGGDGGGDGHRRPNLEGTWYRDGDRSYACSINQRGSNLTFTNEQGVTGARQVPRQ